MGGSPHGSRLVPGMGRGGEGGERGQGPARHRTAQPPRRSPHRPRAPRRSPQAPALTGTLMRARSREALAAAAWPRSLARGERGGGGEEREREKKREARAAEGGGREGGGSAAAASAAGTAAARADLARTPAEGRAAPNLARLGGGLVPPLFRLQGEISRELRFPLPPHAVVSRDLPGGGSAVRGGGHVTNSHQLRGIFGLFFLFFFFLFYKYKRKGAGPRPPDTPTKPGQPMGSGPAPANQPEDAWGERQKKKKKQNPEGTNQKRLRPFQS